MLINGGIKIVVKVKLTGLSTALEVSMYEKVFTQLMLTREQKQQRASLTGELHLQWVHRENTDMLTV